MPVLTLRPDCGWTFSLRMRAVWRHDVFMTRVIHEKTGIDTLYTLRTSKKLSLRQRSPDHEREICRASRRDTRRRAKPKVLFLLQTPFRVNYISLVEGTSTHYTVLTRNATPLECVRIDMRGMRAHCHGTAFF
jgi:hypothetical protein